MGREGDGKEGDGEGGGRRDKRNVDPSGQDMDN